MAKNKIKFNDGLNNLTVDVDRIINIWNTKNPNEKPLDRTKLAEILGVNKQIFVNWKSGKTPKVVYMILKLMELGQCSLDDFIVKS